MADSVGGWRPSSAARWMAAAAAVLLLLSAFGFFVLDPGASQRPDQARGVAVSPPPSLTPPAPAVGAPVDDGGAVLPTTRPNRSRPRATGEPTSSPGGGDSDPSVTGAGSPTPLLGVATSAVRTRPDRPVWRARRLDQPVRIDGDLGEWPPDGFTAFSAVVFGSDEYWEGALDLSARAWTAWDPEALYVGVRVFDNVFSQPATGRELYLGDSLELQIDADLYTDWSSDRYNGDDWQIGISPGSLDTDRTRPAEAWVWRPSGVIASSIRAAGARTGDGYTVEVAVPWSLLEVDPEVDRAIGWALNVSDNDVPEPAQLSLISSSPVRSWSDPTSLGTLVLEAEDGASNSPTR